MAGRCMCPPNTYHVKLTRVRQTDGKTKRTGNTGPMKASASYLPLFGELVVAMWLRTPPPQPPMRLRKRRRTSNSPQEHPAAKHPQRTRRPLQRTSNSPQNRPAARQPSASGPPAALQPTSLPLSSPPGKASPPASVLPPLCRRRRKGRLNKNSGAGIAGRAAMPRTRRQPSRSVCQVVRESSPSQVASPSEVNSWSGGEDAQSRAPQQG